MSEREPLTPMDIERQLITVYSGLSNGQNMLDLAETNYVNAKAAYGVLLAQTRIRIKMERKGEKMTVQDLDDEALVECAEQYQTLVIAEGMVRAAKSNMTRLLTQADIVRSMGASVRESMKAP